MEIALLIIAIACVARVIQNEIQLYYIIKEKEQRKSLHNELIDSLRMDNRTWLHETLEELDEKMKEETND